MAEELHFLGILRHDDGEDLVLKAGQILQDDLLNNCDPA
jgi:hypothetical protein